MVRHTACISSNEFNSPENICAWYNGVSSNTIGFLAAAIIEILSRDCDPEICLEFLRKFNNNKLVINHTKLTCHLKHYFVPLPFSCRSKCIDIPLNWYNIHIIIVIIISIYVTQRTVIVILFRSVDNLFSKLWDMLYHWYLPKNKASREAALQIFSILNSFDSSKIVRLC